MTKYETLAAYLRILPEETLRHQMSFSEVENALGFSLPASARKHSAWWSNSPVGHSHARGWLGAGWKVGSVDMANERVTFVKDDSSLTFEETPAVRSGNGENTDRGMTPAQFERFAREVMSAYLGADLRKGQVEGVPKEFDYVSSDGSVVGDAKYFTMVRGKSLPPAKFSVIAEHVWLLEKTSASRKFLVFGNDRRVPEEWLRRHRHLADEVEFYFLNEGASRPESL